MTFKITFRLSIIYIEANLTLLLSVIINPAILKSWFILGFISGFYPWSIILLLSVVIFAPMKFLIVGLGNVGNEYAHTRHNIGFDVVAAFVTKHGGQFKTERLAYTAEIRWKGKVFVCICPSTYMNLSGRAVKYWMDKEKIEKENMLVVLDDIAIPLNKIRLRPGGSDAGHNGLKSLHESLETSEYPKLRFGIGNDFPKGMQSDFVLGKWKKEEEPIVKQKIDLCVEVIETFCAAGIHTAMNKYNNVEITL